MKNNILANNQIFNYIQSIALSILFILNHQFLNSQNPVWPVDEDWDQIVIWNKSEALHIIYDNKTQSLKFKEFELSKIELFNKVELWKLMKLDSFDSYKFLKLSNH